MKKRYLTVVLLCCLIIGLCNCQKIISSCSCQKSEPTQQQLECEHQWTVIYYRILGKNDIYCPKCQLEQSVTTKQWNKLQVDMNYRKNN